MDPETAVRRAIHYFTEFQARGSFEAVFVEGVRRIDPEKHKVEGWDVTLSYTVKNASEAPKALQLPGPRLRSVIAIAADGSFIDMATKQPRSGS